MFKIYDGRENFYQWDTERKLIVSDASIKEVHFSDAIESVALVCEVYELDGLLVVDVPNVLLQTEWRINVYAFTDKHTKVGTTYKVLPRSKPSDYVYTETEVKSYEALEERLTALEENGGGGGITELDGSADILMTDLATGIYKFNGMTEDGYYHLWIDDTNSFGMLNGVITVVKEEENLFHWLFVGLDSNYTDGAYEGYTFYDEELGYWESNNFGFPIENSINKVYNLDKPNSETYPSTKAVVDYVGKMIANVGGGDSSITEITLAKSERLSAQTLEAGIYKINAPEGLSVVLLGKLNTMIKGDNNFLFIGGAYTEATATEAGISSFDKPYLYLYNATTAMTGTVNVGVIKGTKADDGTWSYDMRSGGGAPLTVKDIVSTMTDADSMIYTKATSPQAVIDYINTKLVPIEIDVGGEHADNEYYNANTVDAVLVEVVGLVEEMSGHIEQFAVALDDLTARVEALEG